VAGPYREWSTEHCAARPSNISGEAEISIDVSSEARKEKRVPGLTIKQSLWRLCLAKHGRYKIITFLNSEELTYQERFKLLFSGGSVPGGLTIQQ
jgi:hypothetical protein